MDVDTEPQPSGVGVPPGLEALYRESYGELVRLGFLLTSSEESATDLCHEAFLSLHRRWDEVDHPSAYLRQAIVRGAAGLHRRAFRERRAIDRSATTAAPRDVMPPEYVTDLLEQLPYRHQAVIVLRFWAGLSEAEIAEATGYRLGSVGPTLHRALARMRKSLEEKGEE